MADAAEFFLRLVDEVSGPARAAAGALRGVIQEMKQTAAAGQAVDEGAAKAASGMRAAASAATALKAARAAIETKRAAAAFAAPDVKTFAPPPSAVLAEARAAMAAKQAAAALAAPKISDFAAPQVSALRRAGSFLKSAWNDWGHGAEKGARSIEASARHVERGSGFLRRAAEMATGIIFDRALFGAIGLAKGLATSAVEMADFGQRAEVAFNALAKHGASGGKIFEHVQDLAVEFGLDLFDTTKVYQKFLAMQFNPVQADTLVKMGADLRAIGASGEEVQRVFLQMTQIKAKNTLQMEELRVMAESGVSTELVMKSLAKQMGISMTEVRKRMAVGAIEAGQALNAIGEAIKTKTQERTFGEAGKNIADKTIGGLWGQLKAQVQRVGVDLAKSLAPTLTATLGSWVKDFSAFVKKPEGLVFFQSLATSIKDLAVALAGALPTMAKFLDLLTQLVPKQAPEMKAHVAAMTTQGKERAAEGKAPGIGMWEGLTKLGRDIWSGKRIATTGTEAATTTTAAGTWQALGTAMWQGLFDGMISGEPQIRQAGTLLGATAVQATASTIDAHSPSREFMNLGQMAGIGFGAGFAVTMGQNVRAARGYGTDIMAATTAGFGTGVTGGTPGAGIGAQSLLAWPAIPNESFGLAMRGEGMTVRPASMEAGRATGGRGAAREGATVSITQNFTVNGSGDPSRVAEEIKRISLSEIATALEQLSIEGA